MHDAELITRTAAAIAECMFQASRIDRFRPRQGTLMFQLWQGKRLDAKRQRAWYLFVADLHASEGRSQGVTASYGDAGGGRSLDRIPANWTNREYLRLEELFKRYLSRDEALLLRDLIQDELRVSKIISLEYIGMARNGYRDEAQARAAGTAVVGCLLDRLARFYEGR